MNSKLKVGLFLRVLTKCIMMSLLGHFFLSLYSPQNISSSVYQILAKTNNHLLGTIALTLAILCFCLFMIVLMFELLIFLFNLCDFVIPINDSGYKKSFTKFKTMTYEQVLKYIYPKIYLRRLIKKVNHE